MGHALAVELAEAESGRPGAYMKPRFGKVAVLFLSRIAMPIYLRMGAWIRKSSRDSSRDCVRQPREGDSLTMRVVSTERRGEDRIIILSSSVFGLVSAVTRNGWIVGAWTVTGSW